MTQHDSNLTAGGDFQPPWSLSILARPMFDDLRRLDAARLGRSPPDPVTLNRWLDDACRNARGLPIRFVEQAGKLGAVAYERRILASGEVPCRPGWHDLFNALTWIHYPRTKSALNAAHVADADDAPAGRRSRRRDALTLLDECGMVVTSADPELASLHARHDWSGMFVQRRPQWRAGTRAWVFGHGLRQQCLAPYPGLTGKTVHLRVDERFANRPLADQVAWIDAALARRVSDHLDSPLELMPLPVLGVPGWCEDNEDPGYYQDTRQFRPPPAR